MTAPPAWTTPHHRGPGKLLRGEVPGTQLPSSPLMKNRTSDGAAAEGAFFSALTVGELGNSS